MIPIRRLSLAVIVAAALLLFARPMLRGEVFSFRDHADYFQPLRWFTAQELLHGRLPLWNPYNASGEPWLANPQTGVFYPPAWLFLLLPFPAAYVLFLALHVALLGAGGFLLFSRFTSSGAALAAALALMFCGPTLSLLDVGNNLTAFAWIPLMLWCAHAGVSRDLCAVAIALSFLAGEPFFAATGALLFALIRRREILRIAVSAAALCAVQLLPFLALVRHSDRAGGGVLAADILRDSVAFRDWLFLAIPPSIGSAPVDLRLSQQFIPIIYLGMVTSVLAVLGLVLCWPNLVVRWTAALIVLCAIVATGVHLDAVGAVLAHLPLTIFRYPARLVPLIALGLCLLAGIGCDRLVPARWHWAVACVISIDLLVQTSSLLASAPFQLHPVPYARGIGRDAKIVRIGMGRTAPEQRGAWVAGYLNLFDRRFDVWTAAPLSSEAYSRAYAGAMTARSSDPLDALSAGYLVTSRPVRLPLVGEAEGVRVYRNGRAWPMAYFRTATSERPIAAATSLAFTTSAAHITIDAPGEGLVVLTQQLVRGWRVTVDGIDAEPVAAGLFRAVRTRGGPHTIIWRYRPASLLAGALITIAASLLLLLSHAFVKHRRDEEEREQKKKMRAHLEKSAV